MFPSIAVNQNEMDSSVCVDEENNIKSPRVQFRDHLNMILIPTRHEFKDAKCDLWWVQKDFQFFRTTAENEIRLLAMIKKITFREAKTKLFQPESVCDLDTHDYNFISQSDPQNTESYVQAFESTGVTVPSSSGSGGSSNDHNTSFPSNFSPALVQYARSRTSSKDDSSFDYSHLHFCVPITNQLIPLRYEQFSERAMKNSALSSTVESLGETGFFAMMGLFSFAAPLLGYYFLSHH